MVLSTCIKTILDFVAFEEKLRHFVEWVLLSTGPSAGDVYVLYAIQDKNLQNPLDSN